MKIRAETVPLVLVSLAVATAISCRDRSQGERTQQNISAKESDEVASRHALRDGTDDRAVAEAGDDNGVYYPAEVHGSHALLKERTLCDVFAASDFGGLYEVDQLVTEQVPKTSVPGNPLHPVTTARFIRLQEFGSEGPLTFEFAMHGGPMPGDLIMTTELTLRVGEEYVVFPTESGGGDVIVRPDAIFSRSRGDGGFANDYLLRVGSPRDESVLASSYDDFIASGCQTDVKSDVAVLKQQAVGRTVAPPTITTEVGVKGEP